MNEFMKLVFSLSFSGTVLYLIVHFLLPPCRGKVGRRWQYYIFLLVVLRFLIPFSSGNMLTAHVFQAVGESGYPKGIFREQGRSDSVDGISVLDTVFHAASDGTPYVDMKNETEEKTEEKAEGSVFWRAAFLVWAAVALALFLRKITVYQSYLHFLKKGNVEVSDIGILNLLSEKEEEMNIKRQIELYQNPLLTSPMMTGFFHPRIIIPSTRGTKEELSYVFAHELVHYKYFDMYYKWLVQITICIHWFNPFVYLLGREIDKNCELACDEKVICRMDASARKKYGDTLLTFLETEEPARNPLASLTLTEGAGQLIERLGAIMDYKRKSSKIIVFTIFLTLGIALCSASLGVYAMQRGGNSEGRSGKDNMAGIEYDYGDREESGDHESADDIYDYEGILYENNTYYILTEGRTIEDKPTGGFSSGSFGIVLVKKDSYTTLGPFFRNRNFWKKVQDECQRAIKDGLLSEAEAEIIYKAAREIEDSGFSEMEETVALPVTRHAYMQRAFYREPYVIEMGWNMRDEWMESDTVKVTLEALPGIPVYFNPRIKQYASDQDIADRIAGLVTWIQETERDVYSLSGEKFSLPIERLYLVNIIYLPRDEIEDYAEAAYVNDEIGNFTFVAGELDQEAIADYCKRAYDEDKIDFFSIVLDYLPLEEIDKIAQTCYEKEDIPYFSIAVFYISEEMRQNLTARAKRDNNMTFYYLLADEE